VNHTENTRSIMDHRWTTLFDSARSTSYSREVDEDQQWFHCSSIRITWHRRRITNESMVPSRISFILRIAPFSTIPIDYKLHRQFSVYYMLCTSSYCNGVMTMGFALLSDKKQNKMQRLISTLIGLRSLRMPRSITIDHEKASINAFGNTFIGAIMSLAISEWFFTFIAVFNENCRWMPTSPSPDTSYVSTSL
jgi:hypothetical protein